MITFHTDTEEGMMLEQARKRSEAKVARDTTLTTTIPSEEYKRMVERLLRAEDLARCVADDWVSSAGISFNEPSKETKAALQEFAPQLYSESKQKVEETEAARKNAANPGETIPGSGNKIPAIIHDTIFD